MQAPNADSPVPKKPLRMNWLVRSQRPTRHTRQSSRALFGQWFDREPSPLSQAGTWRRARHGSALPERKKDRCGPVMFETNGYNEHVHEGRTEPVKSARGDLGFDLLFATQAGLLSNLIFYHEDG